MNECEIRERLRVLAEQLGEQCQRVSIYDIDKDVDEEKHKKRSKNLLNAALEGWELSKEELNELTDEDLLTLAKKTFGI